MGDGREIALCPAHSGLEAQISGLERWQKSQNGTLKELKLEVGALKTWIMGTMATALITLVVLLVNLLRGG